MNRYLNILLLLLLILITSTACTNFLIEDNEVLTLSSEMPLTANVNSLTTDQLGKVCDITKDEKSILAIGRNNSAYTIDSYQIATNSLVNITTSDSRIYDVRAAEDGFFYTRLNPNNSVNIQVLWATIDQSVERVITETYENISDAIFAYGNDNVVFINNSNELIFSDSLGMKESYSLEKQIEVSEITWSEEDETGFLMGRDYGDDYFTLYQFSVIDGQLRLKQISKNVLDINLSKSGSQLAFTVQEKNTVQAYTITDFTISSPKRIFKDTGIEKIHFSNDEKALYFTQELGVGTRSTLWHYDLENNNTYQLTSPLRICSEIIPVNKNNEVFFSASQSSYSETSDIILSSNYISRLVYTLPRNK